MPGHGPRRRRAQVSSWPDTMIAQRCAPILLLAKVCLLLLPRIARLRRPRAIDWFDILHISAPGLMPYISTGLGRAGAIRLLAAFIYQRHHGRCGLVGHDGRETGFWLPRHLRLRRSVMPPSTRARAAAMILPAGFGAAGDFSPRYLPRRLSSRAFDWR